MVSQSDLEPIIMAMSGFFSSPLKGFSPKDIRTATTNLTKYEAGSHSFRETSIPNLKNLMRKFYVYANVS